MIVFLVVVIVVCVGLLILIIGVCGVGVRVGVCMRFCVILFLSVCCLLLLGFSLRWVFWVGVFVLLFWGLIWVFK